MPAMIFHCLFKQGWVRGNVMPATRTTAMLTVARLASQSHAAANKKDRGAQQTRPLKVHRSSVADVSKSSRRLHSSNKSSKTSKHNSHIDSHRSKSSSGVMGVKASLALLMTRIHQAAKRGETMMTLHQRFTNKTTSRVLILQVAAEMPTCLSMTETMPAMIFHYLFKTAFVRESRANPFVAGPPPRAHVAWLWRVQHGAVLDLSLTHGFSECGNKLNSTSVMQTSGKMRS
mmetsp:Transcript_103810/g.201195  ORF Transcript_103810/g.201195 Transcript_103810/m.201195 type:complete len:231 (-) Transcript_103810:1788-2480(-)